MRDDLEEEFEIFEGLVDIYAHLWSTIDRSDITRRQNSLSVIVEKE